VDAGRQDLLHVVEDKQQLPVPQGLDQDIDNSRSGRRGRSEGSGDLRQDEVRLADGRQRHEHHLALEFVGKRCCQLEREPAFAGPARPGDRNQAGTRIVEEFQQAVEFLPAPDDRVERSRDS